MPNVMVALPNIGGALCSTSQFGWRPLLVWVPCSNAAKTQNPLKFARVPQTLQQISAVSRLKFTILWWHVEEVSVFNKFFFRLSIHASAAKTQPDKVVRWCQNGDFLCPVFSASRVQHISDMHFKSALRPHLCGSIVDIQSPTAEIRRGKNRRKIEITGQKYNGLPYYIGRHPLNSLFTRTT